MKIKEEEGEEDEVSAFRISCLYSNKTDDEKRMTASHPLMKSE